MASWDASIDAVMRARGFPSFFRKAFSDQLVARTDAGFERTFRAGVEAVVGMDSESIYHNLEINMTTALKETLQITPGSVGYLAPILNIQDQRIQIATLNYDRSIEVLADDEGVALDTGVKSWSGAFDWTWDHTSRIQLLKLHGSTDWFLESDPSAKVSRLAEVKVVVRDEDAAPASTNDKLAIVFGQRGKLRTEGPFLAMLKEFDTFLTRTENLVVVGYSFRDEHINASISPLVQSVERATRHSHRPWPEECTRSRDQSHTDGGTLTLLA